MFLHLSVILFTGGVCPPPHTTPGQTPPGQTPPWADLAGQTPPWADTPLGRYPPAQCMLGYGQQAGGKHPTGMHSCLRLSFYTDLNQYLVILRDDLSKCFKVKNID